MTTAPPPPPKQQWQKKTCSRLRYSGKNFAVDSNGILTADCTFWDADKKEFGTKKSSLDLKEVLGWDSSSPAHFVWSGSDFKNRGFLSNLKPGGKLEITPNGITYVELKAEMADGNEGKYSVATKDLQERIVIVDGELKYVRNGLTLNDGRTMHGSLTDFMTSQYPECEGVIEPTGTLSTGPGDFVHASQQIAHKDNLLFDTQQYRSEAFVGGSITVKDGQEVTDYQRVLGASVGFTNIPGTQIGTHGTARVDLVDGRVGALSGRLGLGADSGIQTHDKSVRVEFLGTGVTVGRKIGASLFGTGFEIDFGKLW